jgi:hypothetical protein
MLLTEVIVLSHHISPIGIRVDLAKIEVILKLPVSATQKDAHIFLGNAKYYYRFIENLPRYHHTTSNYS